MRIKISDLKKLLEKILKSTYYSEEQSKSIVEVLMYAEITGKNTQGLLKLSGTEPIQNIKPEYPPRVIKETKLSSLIDGGGNPGILVSKMATDLVIKKCKESGFGIVGTRNTLASTGVIGFYSGKIAENGFLGIVAAGPPGSVAPHGSIDPILGTNPISFSFPTEEDPVIFDIATAAITWYGLIRANALGEKLPEKVAIDKEGNPTIDPAQALKGAILPFGGYKGSGLSLIVQILTNPLNGTEGWGNIFIAIDPDLLAGKEKFKKGASELIEKIKNSRVDKKVGKIRIPGEQGLKLRKEALERGEIEIADKLYQELLEKAK